MLLTLGLLSIRTLDLACTKRPKRRKTLEPDYFKRKRLLFPLEPVMSAAVSSQLKLPTQDLERTSTLTTLTIPASAKALTKFRRIGPLPSPRVLNWVPSGLLRTVLITGRNLKLDLLPARTMIISTSLRVPVT